MHIGTGMIYSNRGPYGVMREGMVSIDANIQAVKNKRFTWGHRGRWLND